VYLNFLTLSIIFSSLLISQQSFEDFKRQQEQAFSQYKESVTKEYDAYEAAERAAFEKFKEDVERQWEEFKGSTAKTYVSYDGDLQSRASIDYENGHLFIEVIIDEETADIEGINYYKSKRNDSYRYGYGGPSLFGNFLFILNTSFYPWPQTAGHVSKELSESERKPLFQGLAKSKLIQKLVKVLSETDNRGDSILDDQLADENGSEINAANAEKFAEKNISGQLEASKDYTGKDGKKRKSFSFSLDLKPGHQESRINKYRKEIVKQSKRFNIEPSIAMAITETESSFNPKATSHIPAYGLMQLVPKSGARDAYQYVYDKDKFLGKRYLYNSDNNIELGCAYLAVIRYNYFKRIKDDEKAYMCSVAAYNTGIGNVAKALTGKGIINPATDEANSMSSEKLYKTLRKDLKYKEARDYLERVWSRKDKYGSLIK
jgi:membrane-bound lytic murein transglycosylase C